MTQYLLLCKKTQKTEDNREFDVFYGYQQVFSEEKQDFVDVLVPSKDAQGNPTMKSRTVKVVLTDNVKHLLLADDAFPYRLTLEEGIDFFITVDKTKDGKPRLDKYGKKHGLLVINTFQEYVSVPRKSMTFDDLDNIE